MFVSSTPTLFGRPEAVQSGDGALRLTIVELRSVCDALRDSDVRAGATARRLLSDFSAELFVYFDAEEGDDYFETMVMDCPHLKGQVDRLQAAHDVLRDSAGSLQQLASCGGPEALLADAIGDLVDDFEQHENAENELLQQFLLTDEGVGRQ